MRKIIAWAVAENDVYVSLWLTQKAAENVLQSYQRQQPKAKWEVIEIEITRPDRAQSPDEAARAMSVCPYWTGKKSLAEIASSIPSQHGHTPLNSTGE